MSRQVSPMPAWLRLFEVSCTLLTFGLMAGVVLAYYVGPTLFQSLALMVLLVCATLLGVAPPAMIEVAIRLHRLSRRTR